MNLLCPNCQKMLQVPEQYAGQQMKCPLCAGAFTVPALPQMPAAATVPAGPREAAPMYVPPPPDSAASPDKEKGNMSANLGGEANRRLAVDLAPATPPAGYTKTRSFILNPNVVPVVAPLALLGVFVLLFFPWVSFSPNGTTVLWQSGWEIAGGSFAPDEVWLKMYRTTHPSFSLDNLKPGVGWLMILFLLLFFIALALGFLCVMVARKSVALPPALAPFIPWRSALLAVIASALLLLLLFQMALGFNLESKAKELVGSYVATERSAANTPEEKQLAEYRFNQYFSEFGITLRTWLTLTLWLLVIAIIGAVLDYWLEKRGSQPLPRIDLFT